MFKNQSIATTLGVALALHTYQDTCLADTQLTLDWVDQFGTSQSDVGEDIALDSFGNIYVTGFTVGSLAATNQGNTDVFVRKYDPSGVPLWTTQIGSAYQDFAHGIAVDLNQNVFITGRTKGQFPNAPAATSERNAPDAFITKLDSSGDQLWARQLGAFATSDIAHSVTTDAAGNSYIVGDTRGSLGGTNAGGRDVFFAKYDPNGNQAWINQFGTNINDEGMSIAVDSSGDIYVAGNAEGELINGMYESSDISLKKFNSSGDLLWSSALDLSSSETAFSVALDDQGNPYIAGQILNQDTSFLAKFDTSGNLLWTDQPDVADIRNIRDIDVDADGNAFVVGYTSEWGGDIALSQYSSSGILIDNKKLSSMPNEFGNGIAVTDGGTAYLTGQTEGVLGSTAYGAWDAFVASYVVPEPTSFCILAFGGALVLRRRRRS